MRDHLHKHGRGLFLFGLVGVANTTFDFGVYSVGVLLGVAPARGCPCASLWERRGPRSSVL